MAEGNGGFMSAAGANNLVLQDLCGGLRPGLSKAYGTFLAEAAAICLEDQGHDQGVELKVTGAVEDMFRLYWSKARNEARASWKDFDEAVEYAAYGVAFLVLRGATGYTVLEKSVKGTGFDYWVGYHDKLPFQNKTRLEVSGIRNGDDGVVNSRVKTKLTQVERSDGFYPAYIVIIEFGRPLSRVVKK